MTVVGYHHVRRLQIAVDDTGGMGFRQRIGDLDGDLQRRPKAHAMAWDECIQRLAGHALHHHVVDAIFAVDVVHDHDIWVIQRRGGLCFLHEALLSVRVGDAVSGQDLNGDDTIQARVAGLEHLAHTACAQSFHDLVMSQHLTNHRKFSITTGPLKSR